MRLRSQATGVVFFAILGLSFPVQASALTTLRKVQVDGPSKINLLFDSKVDLHQIHTEYRNDIIQVNLDNVSVYPARIHSIAGSDLIKVFAYQYTPRLVRCRITVKGSAADFRSKLKLKSSGDLLTISVDGAQSDQVTLSSAQASHAAYGSSADASPAARGGAKANSGAAAAPIHIDDAAERALYEKVMKVSPSQPAPAKAPDAKSPEPLKAEPLTDDAARALAGKAEPLAMGKPLPSPIHAFGMFFLVCGIFVALAFLFKKMKQGKIENHKGFSRFVGKFTSFGAKRRKDLMIEVISNHYLGPKKSISVVRVAGRTMVLGVTAESISLITQLDSDGRPDAVASDIAGEELAQESDLGAAYAKAAQIPIVKAPSEAPSGAVAAGPAIFAQTFQAERSKPDVRAQIRSRLEGFKPL